ncbi:MAG: ABC transporter substrate-binding protein [Alphaproteobacteria bacterium]|nr:ABC transporter substrate-binding protein [Alphaproteobacteria bacterium]
MRRRDFIKVAGGAAAWPLVAQAQQSAMPVIGYLSARSPAESADLLAAFQRGLTENGTVEGRNVSIDYRWALGEYGLLPAMAAELVRRPVSVLITVGGEVSARSAIAATTTIPIVSIFADDPVASLIVTSLSRPEGNITGVFNFNPTLEAKRLGLLHELVPQAATIGVLLNQNYPPAATQLKGIEEAARTIGLKTVVMRASTDSEIEAAFAAAVQQPIGVLAVTSDPFFNTRSEKLVALAARYAVPAVYPFREYAVAGGLMSYGVDLREMYHQVGIYAGRILNGAKPSDLPIMQPIKFEFVLNSKTAKSLGIKISDNFISLADDVIE